MNRKLNRIIRGIQWNCKSGVLAGVGVLVTYALLSNLHILLSSHSRSRSTDIPFLQQSSSNSTLFADNHQPQQTPSNQQTDLVIGHPNEPYDPDSEGKKPPARPKPIKPVEKLLDGANETVTAKDEILANYTTLQAKFLKRVHNNRIKDNPNLPLCPEHSPELKGRLSQAALLIEGLKEWEVVSTYSTIQPGGEWSPSDCNSRHRVAVVIPYRDRQSHLNRLLDFLIPILQRQLLNFRFIVTEQYGHDLFNKGRIMNAAFEVAMDLGVDCVIFHDVDMFPQDDRIPYGCAGSPLHLGAFVNSLGYELWYDNLVGGVLELSMADYIAVNGYSNAYWGWGGEDDDMGKRLQYLNMTILRPVKAYSRYTMLKHTKRQRTTPKLIYKLIEECEKRVHFDGLNEAGKWTVKKITRRPLYYHLFVDVGDPPKEWKS